MAETYRAELEVVLRDEHHNIGYGHASVEMEDVLRWLEDEGGVETVVFSYDLVTGELVPSFYPSEGAYLLVPVT